jgi:DNA primase catalytic core
MEIVDISNKIQKNSQQYSEVLSATFSLLKYDTEAKPFLNYLNLRVPQKIKGFTSFGWFPPNYSINKIFQYIKPEILQELDLIYKSSSFDSGHEEEVWVSKFNNHNLIMPYHNSYGDIVGLVGRTLLSSQDQKKLQISKYKNTSILKSANLFGLYQAKKSIIEKDLVYVVEGQFDCITCHRFGYTNVVALGGSSFSIYHLLLLKRFTNNICLVLDNDIAGEKSKSKIINKFGSMANFSIFELKEENDIDEYLNKGKKL